MGPDCSLDPITLRVGACQPLEAIGDGSVDPASGRFDTAIRRRDDVRSRECDARKFLMAL
ncbi:MAG: hypothetical protein KGL64_11060 [Acidobacteriota bacterium]|nr:hypothetical protein [Acidobacteriota bacterium]